MKPPTRMPALKYVPKLWTALLFLLLLAGAFCLFLGRKEGFFRLHFANPPFADYHHHISNFSISFLLYAGIGYLWLLAGVGIKPIMLLGAALILVNLVYEWWLPVLNTRDVVDAYYGVAGTLIAGLFLWLVKAVGLTIHRKERKDNTV
ncbi:MAG: hypothetical protein EOO14_26180 [Chitinophagaceae bacterium]|nr:MAG: hypothetical protein EOO14_26180 [Chitinophagaceae bacterium]